MKKRQPYAESDVVVAACPNCATRKLRVSRPHTIAEYLKTFVGVYPLRCVQCQRRFSIKVWRFSDLRYGRCPKCFRLDLSVWRPADYEIPKLMALRLKLRAKPLRCEFCRCNFASFRARKSIKKV